MGQLVVKAIKLNGDMISYDGNVYLIQETDDFLNPFGCINTRAIIIC